jgi:hypothetical protein
VREPLMYLLAWQRMDLAADRRHTLQKPSKAQVEALASDDVFRDIHSIMDRFAVPH